MAERQLQCPFCNCELEKEYDGEYLCLRCGGLWLPGDETADKFAGWEACYKEDVTRRPTRRGSGSAAGKRYRKKPAAPLPTERWKLT